jgi:hypothetical protein
VQSSIRWWKFISSMVTGRCISMSRRRQQKWSKRFFLQWSKRPRRCKIRAQGLSREDRLLKEDH